MTFDRDFKTVTAWSQVSSEVDTATQAHQGSAIDRLDMGYSRRKTSRGASEPFDPSATWRSEIATSTAEEHLAPFYTT